MATTPGATKRARLSTWPSVWSLSRPSPSQITLRAPSASRQRRLGRRLGPAAVAVGVEQALAGGEHRALAVVVERPALEHEVVARQRRAGRGGHLLGHALVALQHIFAAPAVEAERRGVAGGRKIGPVSRSQMSPNSPGSDLDPGDAAPAAPRRVRAAASPQTISRTRSPPGRPGRATSAATSACAAARSSSQSSAMAREAEPDGAVRRPFGGDEGGHGALR